MVFSSWVMVLVAAHMIMATFLSFLLLTISQVVGMKGLVSRNKNSPFECGFDPKDSARLPFSVRFFLLAIVFLVFDIEIALLFPLILSVKFFFLHTSYLSGFVFLLILLFGLFHEWNEGSLSWVI